MLISTYGARFYGGQIDRIDQGLKELGHNVNDFLGPPDLIYCNDMSSWDLAFHKTRNWSNAKFILNVLDVPFWVSDWKNIHNDWCGKLYGADKITCISQTVQKDIKAYFNIDSEVIYNPIKNIYPLNFESRNIFALFVGRASAPNKRVREIIWPFYQVLAKNYKNANSMIHFVGSENPGFGTYHGIVSDEELNRLYNDSAFTLIPSKQEGLNLPLIESLCAGSIPIVCNDMSTALEFSPSECLCEPSAEGFVKKMTNIDFLKKADDICLQYGNKYREKFSPKSIASNIISVYHSI